MGFEIEAMIGGGLRVETVEMRSGCEGVRDGY